MRRASTISESLRRSSLISLGGAESGFPIDGDFSFPPSFQGLKSDLAGHGEHGLDFGSLDDHHEGHGLYPQMGLHSMPHHSSQPWMNSIESHSRHSLYMPNMMPYHHMLSMNLMGYDDPHGLHQSGFSSLDDLSSNFSGHPGLSSMGLSGFKRDESLSGSSGFPQTSLLQKGVPQPPPAQTPAQGKRRRGPTPTEKAKKNMKVNPKAEPGTVCLTPSNQAHSRNVAQPKMDPKLLKVNPKGVIGKPTPLAATLGAIPSVSALSKTDNNIRKTGNATKRSRVSSSKFRGVSRCSKDGRFQARIRVGSTVKYLGRFKTEEEAARCYDKAAQTMHGERAQFNFPEEMNIGK